MPVFEYHYQKEQRQNPFTGLVSFNHFNNDELYSDLIVRPENNMTETEHVECYPVPDYVEENGREQGYYPDCSVAYIRILWKEFEPKQGEYNYPLIEKILQNAKENNQSVMFRLMPHSTRESDDVPEWVKGIVDCPKRPQGARVKDSPSDPKFLELFGNAIRKLSEKFDSNDTFALLDVSLPGAWGEGDSIDLFTKEQIKDFVSIYTDCFQHTMLIGQIIPWVVHNMNEKSNVGWRADCIGRPNLTFERVPSSVAQMPEVWQKGHISCESYWWLGEWKRQGWNLDKIIDATLSWHISTFNAKSLPIPFEWKERIDAWIAKMGYHFVIDSCETQVSANKLKVGLTIDNIGVAPIYKKIPLHFAIMENGKTHDYISDVDVTTWMPGRNRVCAEIPLPANSANINLGIGIFSENTYVYFATDAEFDGRYYKIAEIN